MSDIRVRRTREKLRAAVLRLAAERPVETVSAAELTRAAGINRTTFYKHADSPTEVLEEVVFAELDVMRTELVALLRDTELPPRQAWERVGREFTGYLERYEAVWTTALTGAGSPALVRLLSGHFADSFSALLAARPGLVPQERIPHRGPGPASDAERDFAVTAYGRFVGHGVVGVVHSWLESPPPRDPEVYVEITLGALPPWLTGPAETDSPRKTKEPEKPKEENRS